MDLELWISFKNKVSAVKLRRVLLWGVDDMMESSESANISGVNKNYQMEWHWYLCNQFCRELYKFMMRLIIPSVFLP
jgi:hypothetical protein